MVASMSPLPVIGVPVSLVTRSMAGIAFCQFFKCRWSTVATVALNGAKNAGILAAQIIGDHDSCSRPGNKKGKRGLEGR
jgi:5-(carboxyamino)imidazole ribonucleotide mutase